MDIRNYYLFGMDIELDSCKLGTIYQPKYKDFIKHKIDYFDFIKVFYLSDIFTNRYGEEIGDFGTIVFLMTMDLESKKEKLMDTLMLSLKILYQTEDVKFIDHMATFIIKDSVVIDKTNFNDLCKVVLDMTKTKVDYNALEEKADSDDELLNEFEKRKREYEERHAKSKDDTSLLDVINIIIHYQSSINYNDILNWTIYQIKNTFETLASKESNYIAIYRQCSMKFDIQELEDWKGKGKLDKAKFKQHID